MGLLTRTLIALTLTMPAAAEAVEDRFFNSNGVQIRYIEAGQGFPVVMIHGYTTDLEHQFVEPGVFDALARHYRVIALDARGHGRSGKPHDPAAYGPEMGQDILRLMDHLGLRRAHILGYSMGAHIVAHLLTTDPGRFASAVLGGASGRLEWTAADQARVDTEAAEMGAGVLRSQILRLWPKDHPPPGDDEIRIRSAAALAGKDAEALAAVRRSNPMQVVTAAQMRAVTVPVLGVVGTADPYLEEFKALRAVMPRLHLVTIPGASHSSAPRRPEFVAALEAFFRAVEA